MVRCLLCERELEPLELRLPEFHSQGLYDHPETPDCLVAVTDRYGIYVDPDTIAPTPAYVERKAIGMVDGEIRGDAFTFVDDVMASFFDSHGLPRLGGASTGRGWTNISTFQRCPYLWQQRYLVNERPDGDRIIVEPKPRSIGTLLHTFLALHYAAKIPGNPYATLTPEMVRDFAIRNNANPAFVNEAWRVWVPYRLFYMHEVIEPLAIEHDLVHPVTKKSTRFDVIAFFPDEAPDMLPGTYIMEHKSAGRFDQATLYGWPNDGEVLGEAALYKALGLEHRFGPLQGVIVNILGKQPKNPQQHRTIVRPQPWQLEHHLADLEHWENLIQLSTTSRRFPRSRSSCVGRYGMCDLFDHCAGTPPLELSGFDMSLGGDE